MIRFLITMVWIFTFNSFSSAQTIKVFYEKRNQNYLFYAENTGLTPMSLIMSFQLTNLRFSESADKIFVVPANKKRFSLGILQPESLQDATNFQYKYISAIGDVTLNKFDSGYIYELPYRTGQSFGLSQGYHGKISHQNQYALDFSMHEGTEILAARDGIVVQVMQDNSKSCPTEDCKQYNNYVTIMHSDGTFGYYAHIKQNGAACKPGDIIKRGDFLAYSGNVGWTTGPHLHFACMFPAFGNWGTVQTLFKVGKDEVGLLIEGKFYRREY